MNKEEKPKEHIAQPWEDEYRDFEITIGDKKAEFKAKVLSLGLDDHIFRFHFHDIEKLVLFIASFVDKEIQIINKTTGNFLLQKGIYFKTNKTPILEEKKIIYHSIVFLRNNSELKKFQDWAFSFDHFFEITGLNAFANEDFIACYFKTDSTEFLEQMKKKYP